MTAFSPKCRWDSPERSPSQQLAERTAELQEEIQRSVAMEKKLRSETQLLKSGCHRILCPQLAPQLSSSLQVRSGPGLAWAPVAPPGSSPGGSLSPSRRPKGSLSPPRPKGSPRNSPPPSRTSPSPRCFTPPAWGKHAPGAETPPWARPLSGSATPPAPGLKAENPLTPPAWRKGTSGSRTPPPAWPRTGQGSSTPPVPWIKAASVSVAPGTATPGTATRSRKTVRSPTNSKGAFSGRKTLPHTLPASMSSPNLSARRTTTRIKGTSPTSEGKTLRTAPPTFTSSQSSLASCPADTGLSHEFSKHSIGGSASSSDFNWQRFACGDAATRKRMHESWAYQESLRSPSPQSINGLPNLSRAASRDSLRRNPSRDSLRSGSRATSRDSVDVDWSRTWLEPDGCAACEVELGRSRTRSEVYGEKLLEVAHETVRHSEDFVEGGRHGFSSPKNSEISTELPLDEEMSEPEEEINPGLAPGDDITTEFDQAIRMVASPEEAMHPGRACAGLLLLHRVSDAFKSKEGVEHNNGIANITRLFFDSMPADNVQICSIEQVVKPGLFKKFLQRVAETHASVEATFHGTRRENVEHILQKGLIPSLCSTGAYGKGSYVATHAGMAHQYADADQFGWRHMVVVLVVVGKHAVKGRGGVQTSLTAMDRMVNPTQYCFVDSSRLCVSHLIKYRVTNPLGGVTMIGGGWEDPFQRQLSLATIRAGQRANKLGLR